MAVYLPALILPLLAPLHKAGSALFQAASVVLLAALYEVPIPLSGVGALFLAIFLVALTVAPVPSPGVVTLAPALDVVGVPLAGLAILLGIDRIPDMCRSFVNITGHRVWAVAVEELSLGRTGPGGSRREDESSVRARIGTSRPNLMCSFVTGGTGPEERKKLLRTPDSGVEDGNLDPTPFIRPSPVHALGVEAHLHIPLPVHGNDSTQARPVFLEGAHDDLFCGLP